MRTPNKVFCRVFSHSRSTIDNHVVLVVEWMNLTGERKSGKVEVDVCATGGFKRNLEIAVATALETTANQLIGLD